MEILFLQRKPAGAQVSIERLFEGVRRALEGKVRSAVHICPFASSGFLPRVKNVLSARAAAAGRICHITGDVHYLAMGLPERRTVLTIHDCAVLHRHRGWKREILRRIWFEGPVRRSRVVTVISEATREDLLRWLPADLHDRVRVVPNSVREEFSFSPKPFNSSKPVFLQVGTGWNKNLERVTEALRGVDCRLEIIGPVSDAQREALRAAAVDFTELGKVTDEELVEAYRRCDALLFASLFEGFGLPVIEAQAMGRPVITSRRGPLPDVAGEGALLVDPENTADLAAAIRRLIAEPDLADRLVSAGQANVRRFQPEAVAARYHEIYLEMAESA